MRDYGGNLRRRPDADGASDPEPGCLHPAGRCEMERESRPELATGKLKGNGKNPSNYERFNV